MTLFDVKYYSPPVCADVANGVCGVKHYSISKEVRYAYT